MKFAGVPEFVSYSTALLVVDKNDQADFDEAKEKPPIVKANPLRASK